MIPNTKQQRHTKSEVLEAIRTSAFIPIVRVKSRQHALCAAEGIVRAGFSLIELTLTIPDALSVIEEVSARFGKQLIIGAGTVLDPEACQQAASAGASFIVSPITDPAVVHAAQERGLLCIPGAQTPTEVFTGWRAGADLIKIFPAGLTGGPAYLRALREPFPQIQFVPSNGITSSNAKEYLEAGAIAVGVGGPIFDPSSLERNDPDTIASNARQFARVLRPDHPHR